MNIRASRKVWTGDVLHQIAVFEVRVLDQSQEGVNDFAQVVRGDIG